MLPVFMNLLRRFYRMRAGARSAQRSGQVKDICMEMQIGGDGLECCEALAELLALCQAVLVGGLVND